MKEVMNEIRQERVRQNQKWGEQNHSPIEWIAILTEEVGEAAKEAVDHRFKNKIDGGFLGMVEPTEDAQEKRMFNYRKELIQVAAVAVQAIECIDRNYFNAPMSLDNPTQ